MKTQSRLIALAVSTFTVAISSFLLSVRASQANTISYKCGSDGGYPATIVTHPVRGDLSLIRWVAAFGSNSEWTPQRRCEQVTKKFNQNYANGRTAYIVPGYFNRYAVLCASPHKSSQTIDCPDAWVLMTLRPGDDPNEAIKRFAELNTVVGTQPLDQSRALYKVGPTYNIDLLLLIRDSSKPQQCPLGYGGFPTC
jgi:hypothetical protein